MQANDLLEYRNNLLMHLKMVLFRLNIKKTDNATYNYTLKNVKDSIQELKSMSEKINLSFFEEFFESSSPADYAKMLSTDRRQNIRFKREKKK